MIANKTFTRLAGLAGGLLVVTSAHAAVCEVPDNGSGTVDLPPAGCGYLSPMDFHVIVDGLPPGTQINAGAEHLQFINVVATPGGNLGGEIETFDSQLLMQMSGTGDLTGFERFVSIPISCEVHTGPRNPGDPVQDFDNEMVQLSGQLFGDPDFCLLRVTAGSGFGMPPSPGHTTLTQLPSGNFNVDSFFDITYQIDFVGCPGSILDGMAGTTTATVRMQSGEPVPPDVLISEIRIDQPSTDNDEYFELIGEPGTSLDGATYIVLGDGAAALGSGVIEAVVDLSGLSIPADGHFLAAEQSFTGDPTTVDLVASLNFENSDNVTHLIVAGFTGSSGDDLDTDDDCVLDITPWSSVIDSIGLVESAPPECNYGPNLIGPDGSFVPGHVFRCGAAGTWAIGGFTYPTDDTPGDPNPPCPPISVFGVPHVAIGQAALSDLGGRLVVSNIGSSGKDGVSIDLGDGAEGFEVGLPVIAGMQPGAVMNIGSSGKDGVRSSSLDLERVGQGDTAMSVRTSGFDASSMTVEVFLNGSSVGSEVYSPPLTNGEALVVSNIGSSGKDGVSISFGGDGGPLYEVALRSPAQIDVGGTLIVQGDLLRISLDGLPPGEPVIPCALTLLTAANTPQFDIDRLRLAKHDALHEVAGEAQMRATGGTLTVSNIGSSGKDGVSIDLGDNLGSSGKDGVSIAFDRIILDDDDESMDVDMHGDSASQVDRHLGSVRLGHSTGVHELSVDYSSLAPTGRRVVIYSGGSPVGDVLIPGDVGDVGLLSPSSPTGSLGLTSCGKIGTDPPCFVMTFDELFNYSPPGGGPAGADGGMLSGDEIRVLAEGTTVSVQSINDVDLTGSNLGAANITGIGGPPCFGDTDGNGAVDVDDLINVILDWGTDGSANGGDVNGSGLVDVDDLVDVILAWGPC